MLCLVWVRAKRAKPWGGGRVDPVMILERGGPSGALETWPGLSCLQLLQRGSFRVPALHFGNTPFGFPPRRICYCSEVEKAVSFGWREVPLCLATKRRILHFFTQYMQRWLQEVRSWEGGERNMDQQRERGLWDPHCRPLPPADPASFARGAHARPALADQRGPFPSCTLPNPTRPS